MKEKIIKILIDNLSYVYCYNCSGELDDNNCDDCHRKYMNWQISQKYAEKITDEILESIKEELIN